MVKLKNKATGDTLECMVWQMECGGHVLCKWHEDGAKSVSVMFPGAVDRYYDLVAADRGDEAKLYESGYSLKLKESA